jgi:cytochrome c-type biogenesis protein
VIPLLTYGLVAGAFAALNPCGFALLPAVVSQTLTRTAGTSPVVRGLQLGALLTLGTLTSFGVMGLVLSTFGTGLTRALPFVNLLLGVALLVLAVLTLRGRPPAEFYPFGVAYGLASLGCTLPVFLGVVAGGVSRGLAEGVALFTAYGLGMGSVLTAVTLAAALGQDAVIGGFRRAGRYVEVVGGLGLLIAGAYLIFAQVKFLQLLSTGESTALPGVLGGLSLMMAALVAWVLRTREAKPA